MNYHESLAELAALQCQILKIVLFLVTHAMIAICAHQPPTLVLDGTLDFLDVSSTQARISEI